MEKKTQEEIDNENYKRNQVRTNLIKFFIEFDIKAIPKNGLSDRKAKKYGFINSCDDIGFREPFKFQTTSQFDHVREYTTNDKKLIIISSPNYHPHLNPLDPHFKYGFKKYHTYLYKEQADTYYLILG